MCQGRYEADSEQGATRIYAEGTEHWPRFAPAEECVKEAPEEPPNLYRHRILAEAHADVLNHARY
jgi:hypothetical protein